MSETGIMGIHDQVETEGCERLDYLGEGDKADEIELDDMAYNIGKLAGDTDDEPLFPTTLPIGVIKRSRARMKKDKKKSKFMEMCNGNCCKSGESGDTPGSTRGSPTSTLAISLCSRSNSTLAHLP